MQLQSSWQFDCSTLHVVRPVTDVELRVEESARTAGALGAWAVEEGRAGVVKHIGVDASTQGIAQAIFTGAPIDGGLCGSSEVADTIADDCWRRL